MMGRSRKEEKKTSYWDEEGEKDKERAYERE